MLTKMGALTKNTMLTMAFRVVGAALVFLLQIILARVLGVNEYGIYSFVISWISIIALIGVLGFDTSLTRFLPEYFQSNQWAYFHGIIKYSFRVCLIFSALIATVIFFVVSLATDYFESRTSFMYALPLIVIVVLTNIRIASLRGMKRYVEAILPETILKPIVFIILISICYALGITIASREAIIILIVAACVSLMVGGYLFKKTVAKISENDQPAYQGRYWLSSSLPMLLTAGAAYIISQTDIIMLGVLKDYSYSGVYSAVSRLSEVAIFFMAAVNFVIAPLISEAYYGQDKKSLKDIVRKSTRISLSLALLSFIVFMLFGQSFLGLFGDDFVVGHYALIILLIGHLFNAASGAVGLLLSLTGYQLYAAKIMGGCALANIFFNYILIPEYGLLGAAFSTMFSTMLWNFLMLLKVRQVLKINPSIIGGSVNEKS